jgi:hypothetical protein
MHSAVTVRAGVEQASLPGLRAALAAADQEVQTGISALTGFEATHFARLFILPGDLSLPGGAVGPSLIYMADVDESPRQHLRRLSTRAAELVDTVFGYCDSFPMHPDTESRYRWLLDHQLPSAASYVNTIGIRAAQVVDEAGLYRWLQEFLDTRYTDLAGMRPAEIHQTLRAAVADDPAVASCILPVRGITLTERIRRVVAVVLIAGLLILLLPVIIVVGVPWLIALRRLEETDPISTQRPDLDSIRNLRGREDQFAYNPFAAAGPVKPGGLRRRTVILLLRGISFGVTYLFGHGSLAGVTTIHFARWVALDNLRRIIFASSYDGSLESYMDDFIDKLAWGLNLIFSNGVGYPRTRWLIFGGAADEQSFKDYLRCHQLETAVAYAAYPTLTTANILNNAAIRQGLGHNLDDSEATTWLGRL